MKTTFFTPAAYICMFLIFVCDIHSQDHSTTTRIDESTNPAKISKANSLPNSFYRCLPSIRVEVVARCPAEYAVKKVIEKCEKGLFPLDEEDVSIIVPVTGRESGIRYANRYCAQCHNDLSTNQWQLEITWPKAFFSPGGKTNEEILSTLRYNETLKSYTVNVTDRPMSCTFKPVKPDGLTECRPQIIEECPSVYQGPKNCSQFPGYFVCDWPNYTFLNAECARCNNFKLKDENKCTFIVPKTNPVETLFKLKAPTDSSTCSVPAIAEYYC